MERERGAEEHERLLLKVAAAVVHDWYSEVTVNSGRDQAAKSYRLLRATLNTAVDDELIVPAAGPVLAVVLLDVTHL